jgi:hypothetical protein
MSTELWWKDQDVLVCTIVSISSLLNPGAHLLKEESKVNDKLVSSQEGEVGDGVSQGGNYNHLTMLILTNKRGLKLYGVKSHNQMRLADAAIRRIGCLGGVKMAINIGVTNDCDHLGHPANLC